MKLLLILFAIAAISTAAVVRVPVTKVESIRARLMRLGEWKQYAIAKNLLRIKGAGHQDLVDYDDEEYIGNISVGTPPTQQFRVLMATDAGDAWVTDKGCTSCKGHSLYDSSKSSTYVPDGQAFKIGYGSAGSASGVLGQDTMTLGGKFGLVVPKQKFGQATSFNGFEMGFDGIVGLGFSTISVVGEPPVINAINQGLLDQPIFTIWLGRTGDVVTEHGGQITYGAFDADHCSTSVVYQPLSSATYWQFRMKSASAGSYSSSKGWDVMSTSFDSYITGPSAVVAGIAAVLGGKLGSDGFLYHVDCNGPKYPIQFVIGANKYDVPPEDYVVDLSRDPNVHNCVLMLAGYNFGGYGPQWSLGDPFSRSLCVVYDVEGQRIGFAAHK